MVNALWIKKSSSNRLGLWPGWKPNDDQSRSSCDPINSGPEQGPLSSLGLQQPAPASPYELYTLELTKPQA